MIDYAIIIIVGRVLTTRYLFLSWGWKVSTGEAGPGMRAERRRTRKLSAKFKCQTHFLCCYAPRCISDEQISRSPLMRSRPPDPSSTLGKDWASQWMECRRECRLLCERWTFGSLRLAAGQNCPLSDSQWQTPTGYARRFPRAESFGRGFDSRHLHSNGPFRCSFSLLFTGEDNEKIQEHHTHLVWKHDTIPSHIGMWTIFF